MRPAVDLSHKKMSFLTLFTLHILMKYIAIDQTDGTRINKAGNFDLEQFGFHRWNQKDGWLKGSRRS